VHGFNFTSNKGYFEDLGEFFGQHISRWKEENP
jgi:hypothetical protein